jgi:hypothetical protein
VPADASSLIPPGLTQLGHADRLRPGEPPDLLAYLAAIDDPRTGRGGVTRLSRSLPSPLARFWLVPTR